MNVRKAQLANLENVTMGVPVVFFKKSSALSLSDANCFRHWFTTWLRRNGMPREFIQELRGDRRREAIDIYDHIDRAELRKTYLAYIPQLGV